jgi:predicted HD phosphohydrolase
MSSKIVSRILELYTKYGANDYIGEHITQTTHALQCAELAEKDNRLDPYDIYIKNCMIVSALLHDIGHLIGLERGNMEMQSNSRSGSGSSSGSSLGIVGHEGIGREFLKDCGMPFLVCELVGSHVQAKRYLCSTRKDYYAGLSDASKETMALQGGMMTLEEIKQFNSGVMPELKIYLREYDDLGKRIDIINNSFTGIEKYKKNIEIALMHNTLFH